MKKRQEGILTLEASISLTIYLFAMMFLMNFGQIYRAQNYMTHGLLQTGRMLAFSSYEYGTETTFSKLSNEFMGSVTRLFSSVDDSGILNGTIVGDTILEGTRLDDNVVPRSKIEQNWTDGKYSEAAKTAFGYCAGRNTRETNQELKRYGIAGGIESVDFTKTCCVGSDLCLRVEYKVDLPFAFFNISDIKMHQQIVCGLWK